jgi:hypothetical protein
MTTTQQTQAMSKKEQVQIYFEIINGGGETPLKERVIELDGLSSRLTRMARLRTQGNSGETRAVYYATAILERDLASLLETELNLRAVASIIYVRAGHHLENAEKYEEAIQAFQKADTLGYDQSEIHDLVTEVRRKQEASI